MTYTRQTSNALSQRRRERKSFQGKRYSSSSRSYGRSGRKPENIDVSLLVKKAVENIGEEVYRPKHNFTDFSLSEQLQHNIKAHGYTTPTPIQDQVIGQILKNKDVIGIANTGTGKTAAFLLPLIHKVINVSQERVLIVAPTRELAVQIEEELKAFTYKMNINSTLCIGGVSINRQIFSLRKNPQFVIGTPGRLKDLEKQRKLNFAFFKTIVLDEVDRMLDMGFIQDIEYLLSRFPQKKHSLFFSATLPDKVKVIMSHFVKDPVTVSVKSQETSDNVEQDVIKIKGRAKIDLLHDLLIKEEFKKVLIFGRTKWGMDKLAKMMDERGFKIAAIHGNKSQSQRQRAIELFKANKVQVLLATDIASRGLDIADITHVINYDLPETYEDYIHRIGRTGRAGKKGIALSFVE